MVPLKSLILVALACTIYRYGISLCFYVIVACISFLIGLYVFLRRCEIDATKFQPYYTHKGIPAVKSAMKRNFKPANIRVSDSLELNELFNQIISYTIRDYINVWYDPLTPDNSFPLELHGLMQRVMANFIKRISSVNWDPVITEELPIMLASHVRFYRTALEKSLHAAENDLLKAFFDCELESEKTVCREFICLDRLRELEFLRRFSDRFLFFILPKEEYSVPAIRYLAREVLVNTVLLPTVDLLSDPDYLNRSVVWWAGDSALTCDYFIQALRMSDSQPELDSVLEQVNAYMDKLRGRDTGGDDDSNIKAQLKSLEYAKNICNVRLKQLKDGFSIKLETLVADHMQGRLRLYDMSFEELLSSSCAIVSFIDFLTSVSKLEILRMYVDCVDFRESALKKLGKEPAKQYDPSLFTLVRAAEIDLTQSEIENVTNSSIGLEEDSDSMKISVESSTHTADSAFEDQEEEDINQDDDPDDLRSFGVLLCSDMSQQLPHSAEPLIQQALRSITADPDPINPDTFATLESKLVEILSHPDCFGAFKKKPQYIQLLMELDLLKDPSEHQQSPNVNQSGEQVSVANEGMQQAKSTSKPLDNFFKSNSSSSGQQATISESASAFFAGIFKPITDSVPDQTGAKRPSERSSLDIPDMASPGPYSAEIVRHELMRECVVYKIRVKCTSSASQVDTWHTLRRFNHFAELHALITNRCGRDHPLKLPSKSPFSDRIRRQRELNEYLSVLCGPVFTTKYPEAYPLVTTFLSADSWERNRVERRKVSIFNQLRTVSSAISAVPDTLVDGFSRILTGRPPQPSDGRTLRERRFMHKLDFNHSRDDESSDPNGPIGMMYFLIDAIFNSLSKSSTSSQGRVTFLWKIFQTLFGPHVNKTILSKVRELTGVQKMAEYVASLRDTIWSTTPSRYRDDEMKLRTRVLCKTVLLGSFPEQLAALLGYETTRRGVLNAFKMFQVEQLNRRFVYTLLQTITVRVFRSNRISWQNLFEQLLCPKCSGRVCKTHSD